jgi:hypothetical protein
MNKPASKRGRAAVLLSGMALLSVLYVVSVGPAFAMVQDPPKGIGAECYRVFYAPLWWVAQSCGPKAEYALARYVFWWGEHF